MDPMSETRSACQLQLYLVFYGVKASSALLPNIYNYKHLQNVVLLCYNILCKRDSIETKNHSRKKIV